MSYNVENLFDDVDNGTEFRDFDPGRGTWDAEAFALRVDTIAEVVRKAVPGGPDILLLQEVENENALRALVEEGLAGMGYTQAVMVPKKRLAANVAVVSRLPVARVHAWQVGAFERSPVRDVLEVEIETGGRPGASSAKGVSSAILHLFANHWKSKTGGARETEISRLESAWVVARRVREILAADPAADVVIAGDFNENVDEYARAGRRYMTALLPAGEETPAEAARSSLFLASSARQLGIVEDRLVLYEPWFEVAESKRGSYVFQKEWQTMDHMLLSSGLFDAKGFSYRWGSFAAVRLPFLLLPDGSPKRWTGLKGARGFSDHLPLVITLDMRN
jgi:endonuclease/exonuclease/phosphatase family metal-dependent hydrolase